MSIKVLLESAIRNCDEFQVKREDVEKIIDWENTSSKPVEIPFMPARVLLQVNIVHKLIEAPFTQDFVVTAFYDGRYLFPQDFTGVPALVDLASLRDAVKNLGGDPENINLMVSNEHALEQCVSSP